ncbi:MAG TPA: hypothetical protein VHP81_08805 [Lachnospiraceae bacterium]|nr:hypothetical protein [Lachnospiraceae bacterium]
MSAFLGPIHFWLYNKIQIQQGIVEKILEVSKELAPGLREDIDTRYGVSETRMLEEVIDVENIHGWLQNCVTQAEYKLAYSITYLLGKDADIQDKISNIFYEKGEEVSSNVDPDNAAAAFKVISDSLLDGMPCDHANTLLEESSEKVVWKRNSCVHKDYWDEVGGNISIFYTLREAFIKGMLKGTSLEFKKIDEVTYQIERSAANE